MSEIIDSVCKIIGESIEKEGRKRRKLIYETINQLVNSSGDPFEMMGLLDNFDKDELIAIIFGLSRRLQGMIKEKERLEDDGK